MPANDDPCPNPPEARRPDAGSLVLVSTPIGNLGDMTPRGITALRDADLILCEDTRTSATLLRHFGVNTPASALHEHNEDRRIPELVEILQEGARIAVISDAGTPLLSDPGYRLARAALAAGIRISATPGANAAITAVTLSGLPPYPFLFAGFLPAKSGARAAALGRLRTAERAGLSATLVFYESPHRLGEALAAMAEAFGGDRPAAVAREITKLFEEVRRGTLGALTAHYANAEARGEITVVIGPAADEAPVAADDLDGMLRAALDSQTVRDAAAGVSEALGLPRKQVYARALELFRARR